MSHITTLGTSDVLVRDSKDALVAHGFLLEPANQQYNSEGDTSFNLLQKQDCKLVVKFELRYPKGKITSHFVAWNGEHIIDTTHKIKVNSTTDRKNPENSRLAFSKLFPKPELLWRITNVYQINNDKPVEDVHVGCSQASFIDQMVSVLSYAL